ncbi:hypothetical protein ACFQFH_04680 [Halobaculum halobium]|uniref:DUF7284 family protein n=1 Tax=Halobaculum halobium TaxID=3032281 RepID=UPI00361D8154
MTGSLLDVCLALLLIGAAAGTIVGADTVETDRPVSASRASQTAETLAASTATVQYDLVAERGGARGEEQSPSPEARRVAHATLAEHLARAAVRSATVDGTRPTTTAADYRRSVRETVAEAVGPRTSVRAGWTPLQCDVSDASDTTALIEGAVTVGPDPPASATVRAARFTVPVGPSFGTAADGTQGRNLIDHVAAGVTTVLFPPTGSPPRSAVTPPRRTP